MKSASPSVAVASSSGDGVGDTLTKLGSLVATGAFAAGASLGFLRSGGEAFFGGEPRFGIFGGGGLLFGRAFPLGSKTLKALSLAGGEVGGGFGANAGSSLSPLDSVL